MPSNDKPRFRANLKNAKKFHHVPLEQRTDLKPVEFTPAPPKRRGRKAWRWDKLTFRIPDRLKAWLEATANKHNVVGGLAGLVERIVVFMVRNPAALKQALILDIDDRAEAGRSEGTVGDVPAEEGE